MDRETAAPAAPDAVLDLAHLHSMTQGDRALEAELLRLFTAQARALAAEIAGNSGISGMAVHAIKGAARGIGAAAVAAAAQDAETAGEGERRAAALERLAAALRAAEAAIGQRLQQL